MSDLLEIQNHGPLISSSNYWDSKYARAGIVYLSVNAGAFRLLIPPSLGTEIPDMSSAREVLISRGPWPEQRRDEAFEILFDDRTSDPYAVHIGLEQIDRVPDHGSIAIPWTFTAWTAHRRKPRMVFERPCWYRLAPRIPYLKPREQA